jgi:hypothetical protein
MSQDVSDEQPTPLPHGGQPGDRVESVVPRGRWFRRRPGLAFLAVAGAVTVLVVAVMGLRAAMSGSDESGLGGGAKPPACAEPGARELVDASGSGVRFQMPECFRFAAGSAPASGGGASRVVLVPVEVSSADGEPAGLIRVSATDIGTDASEGSDEEVEEQLRRGLGVGGADVETTRRNIDGSRGWGFRVDSADRPIVAWTFLKGTMQINVLCRWFDETLEARILAGCGQLVDTLTIA